MYGPGAVLFMLSAKSAKVIDEFLIQFVLIKLKIVTETGLSRETAAPVLFGV